MPQKQPPSPLKRKRGLSSATDTNINSGGINISKLLLKELNLSSTSPQVKSTYHSVKPLITTDESFEQIINMVILPWHLEKFMCFGLLSCLNSFLKLLVILPLKLVIDFGFLLAIIRNQFVYKQDESRALIRLINLKNLVFASLILASIWLSNLDTSKIYHNIKAQSSIKLYMMFGVMEISDKLLSTVGQDLLNYLFNTKPHPSNHMKSWFTFLAFYLASLAYLTLHTIVLIYETIALNVAANSYSNTLVTLLLSNQFSEIKGAVFKKIDREGLFQMSCADVVERFQLLVMLAIISVRNIPQLLSNPGSIGILPKSSFTTWHSNYKIFGVLFGPTCIVIGSELIVDWVKHSYLTKFNKMKPKIYTNFQNIFSCDVIDNFKTITQSNEPGDAELIDKVQQRLGLPVPALFVLVMVMSKHTFNWFIWEGEEIIYGNCVIIGVAFLVILFLKLLLDLTLLKWANSRLRSHKASTSSSPDKLTPSLPVIAPAPLSTTLTDSTTDSLLNDRNVYTSGLVSGGLGAMDDQSRHYLYHKDESIPDNLNQIRAKKDQKSKLEDVTRYRMFSKKIW